MYQLVIILSCFFLSGCNSSRDDSSRGKLQKTLSYNLDKAGLYNAILKASKPGEITEAFLNSLTLSDRDLLLSLPEFSKDISVYRYIFEMTGASFLSDKKSDRISICNKLHAHYVKLVFEYSNTVNTAVSSGIITDRSKLKYFGDFNRRSIRKLYHPDSPIAKQIYRVIYSFYCLPPIVKIINDLKSRDIKFLLAFLDGESNYLNDYPEGYFLIYHQLIRDQTVITGFDHLEKVLKNTKGKHINHVFNRLSMYRDVYIQINRLIDKDLSNQMTLLDFALAKQAKSSAYTMKPQGVASKYLIGQMIDLLKRYGAKTFRELNDIKKKEGKPKNE